MSWPSLRSTHCKYWKLNSKEASGWFFFQYNTESMEDSASKIAKDFKPLKSQKRSNLLSLEKRLLSALSLKDCVRYLHTKLMWMAAKYTPKFFQLGDRGVQRPGHLGSWGERREKLPQAPRLLRWSLGVGSLHKPWMCSFCSYFFITKPKFGVSHSYDSTPCFSPPPPEFFI